MKKYIIVFYFISVVLAVKSQNTRIIDYNSIGWYNAFVTKKITDKWSAHLEYQWRRDEFILHGQQSLLRVGINYKVNQKLLVELAMVGLKPILMALLIYKQPEKHLPSIELFKPYF
jgi:hypothetical protein